MNAQKGTSENIKKLYFEVQETPGEVYQLTLSVQYPKQHDLKFEELTPFEQLAYQQYMREKGTAPEMKPTSVVMMSISHDEFCRFLEYFIQREGLKEGVQYSTGGEEAGEREP